LALVDLARKLGVPALLAEATDSFNRQQVQWLSGLVKAKLRPSGTVGVLGLSYKPESDVVEESQGFLLAQALCRENIQVFVYDPAAMQNARGGLPKARMASSAADLVSHSDVIVLMTPWKEFAALAPEQFRGRVLIDCWRFFDRTQFSDLADFMPLGVGQGQSRPI
jgi:UDPglucose 6-dehydrogenase